MLTAQSCYTYTWQTSRSYVLKKQQIHRLPSPHRSMNHQVQEFLFHFCFFNPLINYHHKLHCQHCHVTMSISTQIIVQWLPTLSTHQMCDAQPPGRKLHKKQSCRQVGEATQMGTQELRLVLILQFLMKNHIQYVYIIYSDNYIIIYIHHSPQQLCCCQVSLDSPHLSPNFFFSLISNIFNGYLPMYV